MTDPHGALRARLAAVKAKRGYLLPHDENFQPQPFDGNFFDDYAVLPSDPLYPGFMNKLRLFPVSPYRRSMFVDAGCLLVKRDINVYWDMARPHHFAITGNHVTKGEWKGADVAKLLKQEGAPYLVKMNSGVFCFDNGPQARSFFDGLGDFYLRRRHALGVGLHRGRQAQTDEIYIGLWMGLNGNASCGGRIGNDSWMNSTWRAFGITIRPEDGISVQRKPRRSIAGVPTPLGGWDRISPSFVHFIGLKSRRQYERLTAYFNGMLSA